MAVKGEAEAAIRNFVNIHKLSFGGKIHDKFKFEDHSLDIVGNKTKWENKLKNAGYKLTRDIVK